jgi:tetratricopeptide (TPR) repeat protein
MPAIDEAAVQIRYAHHIAPTDPQRAMALFRSALAVATAHAARQLQADAELGIGYVIYLRDGQERDSLGHFRRATELAPGSDVAAAAWMHLGDALRFLGELDDGLSAYEQARATSARCGDVEGQWQADQRAGTLLVRLGRYEAAVACLTRAVAQAPRFTAPADAVNLTFALAESLFRLGRHAAAIAPLRAAAQSYRSLGDHLGEGRARSLLLLCEGMTSGPATVSSYDELIRLTELMADDAARSSDNGLAAQYLRLRAILLGEREDLGRG